MSGWQWLAANGTKCTWWGWIGVLAFVMWSMCLRVEQSAPRVAMFSPAHTEGSKVEKWADYQGPDLGRSTHKHMHTHTHTQSGTKKTLPVNLNKNHLFLCTSLELNLSCVVAQNPPPPLVALLPRLPPDLLWSSHISTPPSSSEWRGSWGPLGYYMFLLSSQPWNITCGYMGAMEGHILISNIHPSNPASILLGLQLEAITAEY